MIISSQESITETIVKISYSEDRLICKFKEHNETFRRIIKPFGFTWDERYFCWVRFIAPEINGAVIDRCAELTSILVAAGFACNVNERIASLVENASWVPEHKQWVLAGKGSFLLRWRDDNENLYINARKLPESSWDSPRKAISVPIIYYAEVEGFADEHNFRFTSGANNLLEKAKREYSRMIIPEIKTPEKKQPQKRKIKGYDLSEFLDIIQRKIQTTTVLYPHQIPAVEKLQPWKVGALFMDMGTGKTRCAIELVVQRQQRISKVIWFTPVSLKLTVEAEINKHSLGASVYVFDDKTDDVNISNDAYWYIVGIESMSSSDRQVVAVRKLIDNDTFVIVDESSYIKGAYSKRSMRITELAKNSRYRLLLTGTPISQGIEDLYSQMNFLSPDILGYSSFYSFARHHLEYHEDYKGFITARKGVDKVADRIAPFVYQITKDEALDLPDKLYDRVYFDLSKEQEETYAAVKFEILNEVYDYERLDVFRLFTSLQRIVSGFHRDENGELVYLKNARIEALETVLSGIPDNEKIIIWCKYIESVKQIKDMLKDAALYYGDLSEKQRAAELERFKETDCKHLVATLSTGGHGLTVNEAHYHIFYENEFKYSHRIQAEDRSHRIGQTKPVTYIDIVANAKIDQRIQDALSLKGDAVAMFKKEIRDRKEKDICDSTLL